MSQLAKFDCWRISAIQTEGILPSNSLTHHSWLLLVTLTVLLVSIRMFVRGSRPYIHTYIHTLHYITLHYITLHYITLHYITLHYITLHTIHTYIHTLIHTLHTYILTLHYVTLRYITLHYATLHYITLDYIPIYIYMYIYLVGGVPKFMYFFVDSLPISSSRPESLIHCVDIMHESLPAHNYFEV